MSIKFGCIGDSGTDAYRGTDARGGSYAAVTYNPIELLVRLRGFDMGAWGAYAEPRRTDYAYNWSRSAATSHTLISQGQHTGLAAQIAAGNVDYAFIRIGSNDFYCGYESNYEPTYNGTLAGGALTAEINDCIADVMTAVDALLAEGAGVVGQLFPLILDEVAIANGYTNETNRARVNTALSSINAGLASGFASRNVTYTDINAIDDQIAPVGSAGSRTFEYWGVTMQYDETGDEPHSMVLADGIHTGTVLSSIMANFQIIAPLNARYGLGIKPLRSWEVLREANLGGIFGRLVRA